MNNPLSLYNVHTACYTTYCYVVGFAVMCLYNWDVVGMRYSVSPFLCEPAFNSSTGGVDRCSVAHSHTMWFQLELHGTQNQLHWAHCIRKIESPMIWVSLSWLHALKEHLCFSYFEIEGSMTSIFLSWLHALKEQFCFSYFEREGPSFMKKIP